MLASPTRRFKAGDENDAWREGRLRAYPLPPAGSPTVVAAAPLTELLR
jgi:hypothetical protein